MVTIDETTIAMAFALLSVVFSVVWIGLILYAVKALRDIRDSLDDSDPVE